MMQALAASGSGFDGEAHCYSLDTRSVPRLPEAANRIKTNRREQPFKRAERLLMPPRTPATLHQYRP